MLFTSDMKASLFKRERGVANNGRDGQPHRTNDRRYAFRDSRPANLFPSFWWRKNWSETVNAREPFRVYTRALISLSATLSFRSHFSFLVSRFDVLSNAMTCFRTNIKNCLILVIWFGVDVDLKKHFLSPPYSLSVEVGRNAELRCSPPLGVPSPKVYWLRNGSPLETAAAGEASASADANPNEMSSATGFVQSADGHLLLGEAELRHQGNYSCVAENIAARRVSEPAVLTVYGNLFSFFVQIVGRMRLKNAYAR